MRTAEAAELPDTAPVDELRSVLQEHPVRLGILFGSRATGQTHEASDFDVAVELTSVRPGDPSYNETFFGLSADLSATLETDDVDLVDLHAVPSPLADAIFDQGILILGDPARAEVLRRRLTATTNEEPSARERFDAALGQIDAHLGDDAGTGRVGNTANEG